MPREFIIRNSKGQHIGRLNAEYFRRVTAPDSDITQFANEKGDTIATFIDKQIGDIIEEYDSERIITKGRPKGE